MSAPVTAKQGGFGVMALTRQVEEEQDSYSDSEPAVEHIVASVEFEL